MKTLAQLLCPDRGGGATQLSGHTRTQPIER